MKSENKKPKPADDVNKVPYDEENRRRIRMLLAKPMNKRTNFLRKRLPNGGSCL